MIAIVDYGVGNLRSVERALLHAGAQVRLSSDPDVLRSANGLVLPGVGAFGPALARLEHGGLGRTVVELAKRGVPVFGVCLGYQLLFEESSEHGRHQGLGLLEGGVDRLRDTAHLPVIGWCQTRLEDESPLWRGIEDGRYFYYVHSYAPTASRGAIASAGHVVAAAAARGNVMGTQFHPEKSGHDGLTVYANFAALCG